MNYLLQPVVKIGSVEFEGDFVCSKRHACYKIKHPQEDFRCPHPQCRTNEEEAYHWCAF